MHANIQFSRKQLQPHSLHVVNVVPCFLQGNVLVSVIDVETAQRYFDELEAAGESIPFDDDEDDLDSTGNLMSSGSRNTQLILLLIDTAAKFQTSFQKLFCW